METKVSRNTIYIGNTQIEVEESIPITDEKIEWGAPKEDVFIIKLGERIV